MMAASGSKRDSQFATGFLKAFSTKLVLSHDAGHCRSRSNCGNEFGKIDGDVSVVFNDKLNKSRLLVVEREGSGPGNERNILKWYQAVVGKADVLLHDGKSCLPLLSYEQFDLCLYFTRPLRSDGRPSWELSEFRKTVSYCRMLAELVNKRCEQDLLQFKVHVEMHDIDVIEDAWEFAGACCAEVLLKKLSGCSDSELPCSIVARD